MVALGTWVPVLTIGGETTPPQRARNSALYHALRDGDGTGEFRSSGLAGFHFTDIPISRLRMSPGGESFGFSLLKDDECFRRLLSVIIDHTPSSDPVDDEVARLRALLAKHGINPDEVP